MIHFECQVISILFLPIEALLLRLPPKTVRVTVEANSVIKEVTGTVNVLNVVETSVTLALAVVVKLNESVVDVLKVSVVLFVFEKIRTVEVVVEDKNVSVLEVSVVVMEVVPSRETDTFVDVNVDVSLNVHVGVVHR